ncbi:hypothetical protein [Methylocucumis oryzae]|uniref:Uncharacterized protein n=1 Tax=Methylocucumis oryzae TaxID=1632867 RepID=A0A0F3IEB8_9GAMM|nr:hypothetical protein [Methylocucumis oryzae]KJV05086.1 hypothetical protein VZ94_20725 [Methylocucumis oryzae]
MVHEITTERDRLQADNAKLLTDLDAAKAEAAKQKEAATAVEQTLNNALTAQKASTDEVHKRLDATMAKLHEVIDKYNALNKAKNELTTDYAGLQNTQQLTANELKACEAKNANMYQGAQQVMKSLAACQNRGVIETLTGSEPFTQIGNVEFELLMQEYEDKLKKQKYQRDVNAATIINAAAKKTNPAPVNGQQQ